MSGLIPIGLQFLEKLARDKDTFSFVKAKVSSDYFEGNEASLYDLFLRHLDQYGSIPTIETILELGYPNLPTPEPQEYYLDKLDERYRYEVLGSLVSKLKSTLNGADPVEKGKVLVTDALGRLYTSESRTSLTEWTEDGWLDVKRHLHVTGQGQAQSIYTGFPTADDFSGGLIPGDVVSIVGRPGAGKSYVALQMTLSMWLEQGLDIIFISMEMPTLAIEIRLAALFAGINALHIKQATLDSLWQRGALADAMRSLKGRSNKIWILDGNLNSSVAEVYALVDQLGPSCVYIDGAYMLTHPDPRLNRFLRVAENVESIKRSGGRSKIPTVCTWQFNRESTAKTKKGGIGAVGLEDIGYCLRGDQIITTSEGCMRIEDASLLGSVKVFDGESLEDAQVISVGEKEECVVRFSDNSELVGSPDHRVWVLTGKSKFEWVKAEDLRPGDTALVYGASSFGSSGVRQSRLSSGYIYAPPVQELTENLAELMGLLVGDGDTVSSQSWSLAVFGDDPEVASKAASTIKDCFGYDPYVVPHVSRNALYVKVHSKGVIDRLTDLGQPRCKGPKKYVPACVLQGTPEIRAAFLRGLFEADGGVASTLNNLRLSSTSRRLAHEVQFLLRTLGIDSVVMGKDRPSTNGKNYSMFYVILHMGSWGRFLDRVGFISDRKSTLLREGADRFHQRSHRPPKNLDRGLVPIQIEEVVLTGRTVKMYDVVKSGGEHRFLANGIVVHNSDAIGQISSLVFGLFDDPDSLESEKCRTIRILKGREGENGEFKIGWDFSRMMLRELRGNPSSLEKSDSSS